MDTSTDIHFRARLAALVALASGWPAHSIADDTHILDEMQFSADEFAETLFAVEIAFDIDLTREERSQIGTFGQLVACVEQKAKAEAMAS